MVKKKVAINILLILLAFIIFITWYQKEINTIDTSITTPPITTPSVTTPIKTELSKKLTVYLITQEKTSEFFNYINHGAADMADLLNLNYKWTAPVHRNNEEQIDFINKAVEEGANLILLGVNDPVAVSDAVKNAKAKGVKIIYVDSPANEEAITTLATDNYKAGVTAGENMLNALDEIGIKSGKIGVISANAVTKSMANRDQGFRDKIISRGGFTLLDTVYDNADKNAARELSAKLLDENPDLLGVFATNEISTTALGETIKEKKKNVIGIGFDETNEILNLIKQGYLNAIIVQNPYSMGYLGMAEAFAALNGYETGPDYFDTGVSIITKPD